VFTLRFPPRPLAVFATPLLALLLSGCSKQAARTEDVRPVRAIVLAAGEVAASAEFSGEVRPLIGCSAGRSASWPTWA
jgi:multidrug efflux system membrane fusion protein